MQAFKCKGMDSANIVVIGAGIVGLAIAARLSRTNNDVYVLEKNARIGQEISSHNSGVIHSGIHYPPGTLKAKLCVQGNKLIYDLCKKNGIPFKRLGKLTVATEDSQIEVLEELFRNGESNGVEDLSLLDSKQIKKMEPNVKAIKALYTPSSGIVEQDDLIQHFSSIMMNNGGIISTQTEVTGIRYDGSGYKVTGSSVGQPFEFECKTVINCAGLYSDRIAEMVGLDIDKCGYRLNYYKGDYFRVLGPPPVRMLVYPVPHGAGLGIHLTPDMSGSVRLGPNAYPVSEIDYSPGSNGNDFLNDAEKYLPGIKERRIEYDSSGIRPKFSGSDKQFKDFIIRHEEDRGFLGFINLIGIESPGLTASPAIAEYVSDIYENKVIE
ncbi:MAG: NAD(P)/FAD-dependent oxidoreductase [Thermoplasmata archaeon]